MNQAILKKLDNDINELKNENLKLYRMLNDKDERIKTIETELNKYKTECEALKKEKYDLEGKYNESNFFLSAYKAKLATVKEERNKLKDNLDKIRCTAAHALVEAFYGKIYFLSDDSNEVGSKTAIHAKKAIRHYRYYIAKFEKIYTELKYKIMNKGK